ncbi:MAG: radical SAM protein, partial [Treponema sp.]|nr:radical SAM protein [Treponema sp.]
YFPGLREKYQKRYGNNYVLTSGNNEELMEIFVRACEENKIVHNTDELFKYMHSFEEKSGKGQAELF